MTNESIAKRLAEDFQHSGKLGMRSTETLLALVLDLSRKVDQLERERQGRG